MTRKSDAATLPRGVKLFNPGNVKHGAVPFNGEIVPGIDHEFCQFDSPVMGARAMARVLLTYYRRYGINCIAKIVARYAPPSENDAVGYACEVAREVGTTLTAPLKLDDPKVLAAVTRAMISRETGPQYWNPADILEGVARAFD